VYIHTNTHVYDAVTGWLCRPRPRNVSSLFFLSWNISIYIYIYVKIYLHIYMYILICIYSYIIFVYIRIYMYTYIHIYLFIYKYIYIYIFIYIDSYMCDIYGRYIYMSVCVHIYIARTHRAAVWPRQASCQTLSSSPCATVFFVALPCETPNS
jgi:hypothetical protein